MSTKSIMQLQPGDTVSILGAPFRTVASVRHGWSGNHRAAHRRISIKYTNGEGSLFDSAAIVVKVA